MLNGKPSPANSRNCGGIVFEKIILLNFSKMESGFNKLNRIQTRLKKQYENIFSIIETIVNQSL